MVLYYRWHGIRPFPLHCCDTTQRENTIHNWWIESLKRNHVFEPTIDQFIISCFFEDTKKSIFASTNAVLAMIFGQIVKGWKCWWIDITLALLIVHKLLPGFRCGINCFASPAAFRAIDNAIIVDNFRLNVGLPGVSVKIPSFLVEGDQCCMICQTYYSLAPSGALTAILTYYWSSSSNPLFQI